MSFDLFFRPSRPVTDSVERRNPFTGEIQAGAPAEPLNADEVRAVRGVLAGAGARGSDEFGCFVGGFGDGGGAEVFAGEDEAGCMVALRGLTPDLLRFLFDLLSAADWALLPAMEGNPAIVASPGLAGDTQSDFLEVACGSPDELGEILSNGFEAWRRFRDRAVGE